MFCRNCGNRMEDGEAFCSQCGMKIELQIESRGKSCAESQLLKKKQRKNLKMLFGIMVGLFLASALIIIVAMSNNVESSCVEYTYDDQGNLVEEVFLNRNDEEVEDRVYEYDDHGNQTALVQYYLGRTALRIKFSYDGQNNLTEVVCYRGSLDDGSYGLYGGLDRKLRYSYDSAGNVKEVSNDGNINTEGPHGMGWSRSEYYYDNWGNVKQELYYGLDEELLYKFDMEYDEKGNLIEKNESHYSYWEDQVHNISSHSYKTENRYNNQGILIEKAKYDDDGKISRRMVYNNQGSLVEEVGYYSDGTVDVKEEYEYDSQGNLTAMTKYYDGEMNRKIECEYDVQNRMIGIIKYGSGGREDYKIEFDYNSHGDLMSARTGDRSIWGNYYNYVHRRVWCDLGVYKDEETIDNRKIEPYKSMGKIENKKSILEYILERQY